jgi:hypothetical protein
VFSPTKKETSAMCTLRKRREGGRGEKEGGRKG